MPHTPEAQKILADYEAAKLDSVDRNSGDKFLAQVELEQQKAIDTLKTAAVTEVQISSFLTQFGTDTVSNLQAAQSNLDAIKTQITLDILAAKDAASNATNQTVSLSESIGITQTINVSDAESSGLDFGTLAAQNINNQQLFILQQSQQELFEEALRAGEYAKPSFEDNLFLLEFTESRPEEEFEEVLSRCWNQTGFWTSCKIPKISNQEELDAWDKKDRKRQLIIRDREVFEVISDERNRILAEINTFLVSGIQGTEARFDLQIAVNTASKFIEQTLLNDIELQEGELRELQIAMLQANELFSTGQITTLQVNQIDDILERATRPTSVFTPDIILPEDTLGGILRGENQFANDIATAFDNVFNPPVENMVEMLLKMNEAQVLAAKQLGVQAS